MPKQTLAQRIAAQLREAADAAERLDRTSRSTIHPGWSAGDLFSWTVVENFGDPPGLGAVGACDDLGRAIDRLADALQDSPLGAVGLLHKVTLDLIENGYWYTDLLARAVVEGTTDVAVACEGMSGGLSEPLSDVFAEAVRACEDIRPESFSRTT